MRHSPLPHRLRRAAVLCAVLCLACVTHPTPVAPASRLSAVEAARAAPAVRHFERVFTIVFENQDYLDVIADPYFGPLAQRGASFTTFHALFHPSYPNYLSMVSGRSIPTHGDNQIDVDVPTIADLLVPQKLTWKNYAEGYPGSSGHCFLENGKGKYARKHVPFLSFLSVQKHGCDGVVAASQFAVDLQQGKLPDYAFFSPDLDDDGHDPVWNPQRGLAKAAKWLQGFLEPLLANPAFRRGTLVIVTFDESKGSNPKNQIYTVFLGDMVRLGPVAASYNHFNVLRTIEDNFGLGTLAEGDGGARPITEVWTGIP